jgi:hypothetical protein
MCFMTTTEAKRKSPAEKQAELIAELMKRPADQRRPWEKSFGWAKDDPIYEEAMKLGAEYRRSQRENYD